MGGCQSAPKLSYAVPEHEISPQDAKEDLVDVDTRIWLQTGAERCALPAGAASIMWRWLDQRTLPQALSTSIRISTCSPF